MLTYHWMPVWCGERWVSVIDAWKLWVCECNNIWSYCTQSKLFNEKVRPQTIGQRWGKGIQRYTPSNQWMQRPNRRQTRPENLVYSKCSICLRRRLLCIWRAYDRFRLTVKWSVCMLTRIYTFLSRSRIDRCCCSFRIVQRQFDDIFIIWFLIFGVLNFVRELSVSSGFLKIVYILFQAI